LDDKSKLLDKKPYFFIKQISEKKYELDENLTKSSSKFDGIKCIATNMKEFDVAMLLDNYKHLYQVEHSFRSLTSYFELRTMFHWSNNRILGHVCLNYISYALLIYLQNYLKNTINELSELDIRNMLNSMKLSLIQQGNKYYYIRSHPSKNENKLLNLLTGLTHDLQN